MYYPNHGPFHQHPNQRQWHNHQPQYPQQHGHQFSHHVPDQQQFYAPHQQHDISERMYREITIEEAIRIGREQVPGQVVKVELERRGQRLIYEVDIVNSQGVKYEVEIDASTGEVIDVELD